MAFKTITQFEEDKRGNFFILENDGDTADVIFLFKSIDDALMAKVHYVKYSTYSGYVQCSETDDCPVCKKGIRTQDKLFIPVYNITRGKIEVWDRTSYLKPQLLRDVFANFPNPSEYVFQIKRNGAAHDQNTTYSIQVIGKNSSMPYDAILAREGKSIFDVYGLVCKDMSKQELEQMIALDSSAAAASTEYVPRPRTTITEIPDAEPVETPAVDISDFQADPSAAAIPEIPAAIPDMPVPEGEDFTDDLGDVKF